MDAKYYRFLDGEMPKTNKQLEAIPASLAPPVIVNTSKICRSLSPLALSIGFWKVRSAADVR